jgi:hypothetical protein
MDGALSMSTAQRVSRGFHRLALFLAAIPLVIGSGFFVSIAFEQTNAAKRSHDEQLELVCAQALAKAPTTRLIKPFDQFDASYDLKELGCSEQSRKVSWHDMIDAPSAEAFSYSATLLSSLWWYGVGVSLGVALAVYGLVRAIGWVIGGFAAV